MKDDAIEPIGRVEPELAALLKEEHSRAHASEGSKERVRERLALSIGSAVGSGGSSSDGGSGSAGSGSAGASRVDPSGALGNAGQGGLGGTAAAGAALSASRMLPLLGAFLAGGIAGGAAVAALAPPHVVVVEGPIRESSPAAVAPAPVAPATPASVIEATPTVNALRDASPPSSASAERERDLGRDAGLAREKTILDTARTALGRGESDHALAAVERHAREFPRGQMREEREALAVQALVNLGRDAEAIERGARFQQMYANSVLAPVVDAALENAASSDAGTSISKK